MRVLPDRANQNASFVPRLTRPTNKRLEQTPRNRKRSTMFRRMLFGALAAGGLLAATAGVTEAAPYYHSHAVRHAHVVRHREFCSMGEARAWVRHHHVHDVRFEWRGGHVWVFYS